MSYLKVFLDANTNGDDDDAAKSRRLVPVMIGHEQVTAWSLVSMMMQGLLPKVLVLTS